MRKVMFILPSPIMARNLLHTQILPLLQAQGDVRVLVVSPSPGDEAVVAQYGASWHPYFHPRRSREPGKDGWIAWLIRMGRYARYLAGLALHMSLTYRFNTMAGFKGFRARLNQSFTARKIYLREGLPMSRLFGFPFAKSPGVYRLFVAIYYRRWQGFGPVEKLVADFQPDLMVMSMIQTHMVTPYALAARHHGVKVLGINGSWDQPTTKGPLCPGVARILVQNDIVRKDLSTYHSVPEDRIRTIGWLQMDAYAAPDTIKRQDVLQALGVPAGHRYILFAANAPRLGTHEPEVFRELAGRAQAGEFGAAIRLIFRCHPQDIHWRTRWAWALDCPGVVVQPPDLGSLHHLATVIRHAALVIASAGSINLDAVALDTPTIGLAWETANLSFWDRPARAYDLEHLQDLRQGHGMMFASDMRGLVTACKRYLADPGADAEGRADIRSRYLFQLDGGAAPRLAAEIRELLP